MKALIVYDSFFGNTEKIAQAIGQALGSPPEIEVVRVTAVKLEQLAGLQWLIVGSPTRGFNVSPFTKAFLAGIPAGGLRGVKVAAFDTRSPLAQFPGCLRPFARRYGYAAEKIAKALTAKGGELALPADGFAVQGSEGPLAEGELERAAEWARRLV
jgi:flavodoxin